MGQTVNHHFRKEQLAMLNTDWSVCLEAPQTLVAICPELVGENSDSADLADPVGTESTRYSRGSISMVRFLRSTISVGEPSKGMTRFSSG